eukprot:CAMPEP_0202910694 /NCGR_PEP_ID=MMETSP1392-20130828/52772_1 /ASSEMBLY_ACC=CAM_ASM_000868 /TAXON_ID=225041 /ORGANISM="Chlamydomonas chlamydogama, Strain SAG 11-48b" /LENGTH=46 /DNA_ID= /DNA_START= /DNA_END= /DNA_ORIENTATION=
MRRAPARMKHSPELHLLQVSLTRRTLILAVVPHPRTAEPAHAPAPA